MLLSTTPAGAQTAPWQTFPAEFGSAAGSEPGVVIVGDSLIAGIGSQQLANHMRTVTGRGQIVSAAGGAQWVTYGWPGQQAGNSLIWDYAKFVQARLTIAALATNDARIITQHPAAYDQIKQYNIMAHAVAETRKHSSCVILVNLRVRTVSGMSSAAATTVNNNMLWLASGGYAGGRVFVADWNAHSANHPEWFLPNDVHMTPAGKLHYAAFISSQAQLRIASDGC